VFQGASSLSLDAKGRLSMPTRHRDVLSATAENQLTITKHPHGCLMIFPRPEWEKFRERIARSPWPRSGGRESSWATPWTSSWTEPAACWCRPSCAPRPASSKDTMLLGMGNHFELWDKATYEAKEAEADAGEMPDAFRTSLSEAGGGTAHGNTPPSC
jgi:MraZ protein